MLLRELESLLCITLALAGIEPMKIVHLRPWPEPAFAATLKMTSQVTSGRVFACF